MYYLSGEDERKALEYITEASDVAKNALCDRAKCGAVIVQSDEIIGRGFNSPPGGSAKRCSYKKDSYHQKVTDKTCCIHAEQRAVMDALRNNADQLPGSRLYFSRLDETGSPLVSGDPYCTICSKMVLDAGVTEFVLWQKDGVCVYDADEYNDLSYGYNP